MKKHVLILGAGFGGLELATRLSETMSDAVRVTLVDRNDSWYFGYSKLDVMLGRQSADDVRLYYGDVVKDAVEFRRETVTGIDPAARRVSTDLGSHDADYLVRCTSTSSSGAWPTRWRSRLPSRCSGRSR